MRTQVNRATPLMPAQNYQTYAIRAPLSTHFRKASCKEVECEAYTQGWTIPLQGIDPRDEYIARHSGKQFKEVDGSDFGIEGRFLVFPPGQPGFCDGTHRVSLQRPEFFFVGRGDHRLFTPRRAQSLSADNWQDHMANHLDRIKTQIERG